MWTEPNPDPGGDPPESSSKISRQLSDLKDENEQQKLLIAQLKGMLRNEQSNVSQEKIDEYVNTLKKVTAKKSRVKKEESSSSEKHITIESGKTEKLNLLKQQLEQNKARLAERGKSQKGIEEMVTQLKAELNDSQQLINAGPLLLVDPKTLEYSKTSNPEELYNILLMKEQKITDLMSRTQKQEAKILDLQENLKEKDSVIEARTKAITLMTDSLSKKGKTTLDALDETKEQMRNMQENFVTLEKDMKARQLKLLEDLKTKNFEIQELKEVNEKRLKNTQENVDSDTQMQSEIIKDLQSQLELAQQENKKHLEKISDLDGKLKESLDDIKRLKSVGASVGKTATGNDDEVNKLKKQLDDSNKNMIKFKAQSKSKIKDLTKKLEAFKKMSDSNALIADLQNENTRLSEKVAELEEEKGNMQLKMVESSDSLKDSTTSEEFKQLQDKNNQYLKELHDKEKVISLLEADIIALKEEISNQNLQISNLAHLENAQVTSEMKSIQIEEQLDQLENENSKLKEEIDNIHKQNNELSDKINELTKEKQELSTKLENYIQENMDLIDKLEKLSAEKVSSAESIEIVEGLTQQEKLELAAYQKTMDVNLEEHSPKIIEDHDDTLEAPPELNESVHRLTEDSAELLRKIEMFNAERKEVMTKMEALKEENNGLSLKVQEIENNRDILADTYEQLQTEKEDILREKEALEEKLKKLESGLENKAAVPEDSDPSSQLHALESKYDKLIEENDSLRATIKDLDTKIHEKHELETQLIEYRNKIENLEIKLQDSLQELSNYEGIIEENKNELISSANTINNLEVKLKDRENEINELNVLINDLNNVVNNLQAENDKVGNFELMETKFEELKMELNTQIEQAQDYAEELEHNKEVITDLNEKLMEMNRKILDTEHEIEIKDIEMEKLKHEIMNKDDLIKNLQSQLHEKEEQLKLVTSEMKDKYLILQKQLDGNNGSLEKQIGDLTIKNKEQLEKMKKIAANLKKKTQAYQELEQKYNGEKEKWETELKEKETLISQVKESKEEIDQKTSKLEECEARMRELTDIVQNQEQELENLRIEMRRKQENLHEVSLKQELSTSLHEEFDEDHGTNDSTQEDKIKELELIIEMKESDLSHYKDRLQKIEQDFEKSLEDRNQFERKAASLEEQLSLVSRNMEEKALVEEELGQKLQQVSANDEVLVRKLEESTSENNELSQKLKEHEELIMKLKIKLKKAHEKVTQLKSAQQASEELEIANTELKKQLVHLETIHRHTQEENELLQKKNQSEYEKIENDYQIQLEELVHIRNELMVECEKLKEDVKACKDKEEELLEEISELKLKMEGSEQLAFEVEKLSKALEAATNVKNESVKEIEQLTATIQKQELEIEKLQKQLIEKAAEETVEEVVELATDRLVAINTKETQTETNNLPNEIAVGIPHVDEAKQEGVPTFQWPGSHEATHQGTSFSNEQPFVQSHNPFVAVDASIRPSLPPLSDLESQIMSEGDIVDAANNRKALQEIEFEKVDHSFGGQSQAVIEEVVKPKQAYVTFQPGAEAFGENDDGWGWGPEESKLEEEHQNRAGSTPQVENLKMQLAQATEKLQVLQLERENHLEEIKQLQVKSGKLIKKCKELKTRNDQLMAQKGGKKPADEFFDLNDAIQEELKSQITQLEKRIKEITAELEKEKAEKKNILNRVDVLTAANERMLEMKEIQDTEVLRWKRKFEESEEKLQQYEWGSDGFSERPPPKQPEEDSQSIEELQRTIKELSLDNEELQSLLNEQRDLRLQAEKSKVLEAMPSIPPELENKIKHLEHELTVRNSDIQAVLEEKSRLIDSLQVGLSQKEGVIESLEEVLFAKTKELEDRMTELKNVHTTNDLIKHELQETVQDYRNLKESFDILMSIGSDIEEMKIYLGEVKEEKQALETALIEKDNQLREVYNQLNTNTFSKSSEVDELKIKLNDSEKQRKHLHELLNEKDTNLGQLRLDIQTISSQLQQTEVAKGHLEGLIKEKELELENLRSTKVSEERKYQEEFAELSHYKEEKLQLEALITEKDTALNQYKVAYDQLMGVNDSLSKQNEFLTVDMENLNKKISELQNENANLQESLNQLELEKSNKVENLERTIEEMKEHLLNKEVNVQQGELQDQNKLQDELNMLRAQKQEVDFEVERLKLALEEKQKEFELVIADLEMKWASLVDERGNTVAESWKNHLGMVKTEFAAVQEKMKLEIHELEEKCNVLVEENNELRRNINAEVNNEVDTISAVQQQVHEKQQALNDLNLLLSQAQHENNLLKEQLASLGDASEKEEEIKRLKFVLETTQQQFEEKREVLEEIVKILETFTLHPITLQKEDIMSNFNDQLRKISKYENDIQQLRVQIEDFKISSNVVKETEAEITHLKQTIDHLNQLIQEKDHEISRLTSDIERLQSIQQVAQDKEGEIFRLNELVGNLQLQVNSVVEKDDEIARLKQNIDHLQGQMSLMSDKEQEIASLHGTIEDYKKQISQLHENFSLLQEEKSSLTYYIEDSKRQLDEALQNQTVLQTTIEHQNQQIQTLSQQLQQYETYATDSNKTIEQLQTDLARLKEDREVGQKSLAECQQQLFTAMQELSDKTQAFSDVIQQLNANQQHIEALENDLISMRQSLEIKEREYADSLESLKKTRFTDIETHYEEVLAAKNLDLEKAKAQLQESLQQNQLLTEKLVYETGVKVEFETKAALLEDKTTKMEDKLMEQLKLMEEEEKQLEEMRAIIEEQVVKIEELKKELFAKSNDYDSLIAEVDMGRKNISQQQVVRKVDTASVSTSQSSRVVDSEDLADPVKRAELDLALYMLHQRDVRCEELTVELTELLEERDTLQLRLSNAIREKEELRRKLGGSSEIPATSSTPVQEPSTPSRSKSSQIFLAASGAELATEASETLGGDLANKLSELKMVGYKKDKTFVDEQQIRRLQQMSIMEQHIKEAAKLPPEAAAKLVDATYTLSRDVQSPSKVILNWLWGRSTPRQNDT